MTDQLDDGQGNTFSLARAFSLPLLPLVLALLLLYAAPSTGEPSAVRWIHFPEILGGDYLRNGLRSIAILFGLSCLPGGLLGATLGYLISQRHNLASASISLLRIGQWAPFVIWWSLVTLLLLEPGQKPGRYFLVWTMSIPAVLLGTCYHFLCVRQMLRLNWRTTVSKSMGVACHRAMFISLVLALSVWSANWVVFPGNENVIRHYVAVAVLALFLIAVNWTYRSGIELSAVEHREMILANRTHRKHGSAGMATVIVLLVAAIWHFCGLILNFSTTPVRVFNAAVSLLSAAEIWRDAAISLIEIFAGVIISGVLAFIVSATMLTNSRVRRWILPVLSVTFVIPIVMLPAWHNWILHRGSPLSSSLWTSSCVPCFVSTAICVVCLSFYPLMQTVWAFHEQPILCRILFAVEHALPYGFAAILYGEMMSATSGLGFAVVVATAQSQLEKGFAIFLVTLSLLLVLSSALRFLVKRFFPPRITQPMIND